MEQQQSPTMGQRTVAVVRNQLPAHVRYPGRFLVLVSVGAIGVLAALGVALAQDARSWTSYFPLLLAGFLSLGPLVLVTQLVQYARAKRRYQRAQATTERAETLLVGDAPSVGVKERFSAAAAEFANRDARHLPRIEAAQRAARQLAGDKFDAPIFQQDWRVGAAAIAATIASIPFAVFASIVTAINLMLR